MSTWERRRDEGTRLIRQRDLPGAIDALTEAAVEDPGGRSNALLGLANFQLERYGEAATRYACAVDAATSEEERAAWSSMLATCRANDLAELQRHVPAIRYFDGDALNGPPPAPKLPPAAPGRVRPSLFGSVRYVLGHGIGSIASVVFDSLADLVGRRYRGPIWTTWYRKRSFAGVLTLAYMREKLNEHNLRSTYPDGVRVGFQPLGLPVPDGVTHFRTADGTWNNLADPKEGAAGTRFARNVADPAIRPADATALLSPNPRLVSRVLLTRKQPMQEVPFLNLLAASWIQFQTHDWINHGETVDDDRIEIPLDDDDPARAAYQQDTMVVGRTQTDPTHQARGEHARVTYVNEVTHWWDGSQLYGSDQATQDRLRSGVNGKLRLEPDGRLPLGADHVEDTGFVRNWWVGLSMLHTLFAREHNAICDHLWDHHPDWDDDRLFNVARLINAAVMAKIHSIEWTPAILPNPVLDLALNSNWYGILTYTFRRGRARKTVAEFNVSNPELGGLVGNALNKHGSPFALSEEFAEVYRLHSLLPEELVIRQRPNGFVVEEVPLVESRQAGSPKLTARVGMADLFYSFGNQHPGQLVLNNFPRFMQEMSVPGNPLLDMGAVDLLRARERGVPRYNEFRRQLGLNPIGSFTDLTDDTDVVGKLETLYEDVEQLDLLIGTLAEKYRPTGFGFGETMFQIFILNASRRLQADRFYTDCYCEEVYTREGMAWVDDASFKKVILRHFPELATTGLGNIKNAFEPWDTAPMLDEARHPLRAFDPELKKHPWRGDAAGRHG